MRTTLVVAAFHALPTLLLSAGAARGIDGSAVALAAHDGAGRALGALDRRAGLGLLGPEGIGERESGEDGHGGTDEQHRVRWILLPLDQTNAAQALT